MIPAFIILVVAVVFLGVFLLIKKGEGKTSGRMDTDNLQKHFGDDYGRILGSAQPAGALPPASEPTAFTSPAVLGRGPVSTVIKQKMSGAAFLGIGINVIDPQNIPVMANVGFCNLVSLMAAKGLGACAKSNSKSFSIEVKTEGENTFIRCIYPAVAIPASDENIRASAEALGGTVTSETGNSVTSDVALIPTNNIS